MRKHVQGREEVERKGSIVHEAACSPPPSTTTATARTQSVCGSARQLSGGRRCKVLPLFISRPRPPPHQAKVTLVSAMGRGVWCWCRPDWSAAKGGEVVEVVVLWQLWP
ncbi:hypothetical protein E2C01_058074 [Portunus trituberculatus]|uniref:Uncharacterized protein n=1 Tax=Portunus trituberculatus TaxID=210409 RepID=A0A5B7H2S9_PORTR|nr:hypothetical protein [Portunus trituberculatus]